VQWGVSVPYCGDQVVTCEGRVVGMENYPLGYLSVKYL